MVVLISNMLLIEKSERKKQQQQQQNYNTGTKQITGSYKRFLQKAFKLCSI